MASDALGEAARDGLCRSRHFDLQRVSRVRDCDGKSSLTPTCAHPRAADWRLVGSALWVCGVCHPPALTLVVERRNGSPGTSARRDHLDFRSLGRELLALVVGSDTAGFVEVRGWRGRVGGPPSSREWYAIDRLDAAVAHVARAAQAGDVFVGMAPRTRRRGGNDAVDHGWIVSADLDSDDALDALARFRPEPSVVIASGSRTTGGRRALHAHWLLSEPIDRDALRRAKATLAAALSSDPHVVDPARIMRVPGTRNHKTSPPTPVQALVWRPDRRYSVEAIVGELPVARMPMHATAPAALGTRGEALSRRDNAGRIYDAITGQFLACDPLQAIAPPIYVARLLELSDVPCDGKISCPFAHAKHGVDQTPSFHVYGSALEGWYCYGCERGGTVIDLGACVAGVEPPLSRRAFRKLCDRLRELFVAELAG